MEFIPKSNTKKYALISIIFIMCCILLFFLQWTLPIPIFFTQVISIVFLIAGLCVLTRYVIIRYVYFLTDEDYSAGGEYLTGRSLIAYKKVGKERREICQVRIEGAEFFTDKAQAIAQAKKENVTYLYNFTSSIKPKDCFFLLGDYGSERVLCQYEADEKFTGAVKDLVQR